MPNNNNDKIERVAKALFIHFGGTEAHWKDFPPEGDDKQHYRGAARAVLAAAEEPGGDVAPPSLHYMQGYNDAFKVIYDNPPGDWRSFGSSIDKETGKGPDYELEFAGKDEGGDPLWERPARSIAMADGPDEDKKIEEGHQPRG